MLKDKNENLEISIDTLEKSNSVLHQSNNNLQKSFDSSSLNSIASQIVTNSIAGAKGFVLIKFITLLLRKFKYKIPEVVNINRI